MARRKKKTNVQLPRDREERLKQQIQEDLDHVIFTISDVEMDADDKEEIIEILSDVEDVTTALLNCVKIPRGGLKYPWDDASAN